MKNFTYADEADPAEGSLHQLDSRSSIQPNRQNLPHSHHIQLSSDRFDSTADAAGGRTRWSAAAVGCSTAAAATHRTSAAAAFADSDIAPVRSAEHRLCRYLETRAAAATMVTCPRVSSSNAAANGPAGSGATATAK